MGKTISQFDAPWVNYPGNNFDGLVGGGGTVTGVNQFTYTAQFGNGVSGTLSAQDPTAYYQTQLWITIVDGVALTARQHFRAAPTASTTSAVRGSRHRRHAHGRPGLGSVPGVVCGASTTTPATTAPTRSRPVIPTTSGAGRSGRLVRSRTSRLVRVTRSTCRRVYTDGATRYNFQSLVSANFLMYGGTSCAGRLPERWLCWLAGRVSSQLATGSLRRLTTWGFRGAFTHNWDPYWNSAIYGAYASVQL